MKSFKYSLEAVRRLRERQEQAALHDYGRALRVREEAKARLESVRQELEGVWREFDRKISSQSPAHELMQLQRYGQAIEGRRGECERNLKLAADKAHDAFTHLLSARQASAVLEKHFENRKRGHDRQQRRLEQKRLDDFAARRNSSLRALMPGRE